MTAYDWFIACVAIPGMIVGFTGLVVLWVAILREIWREFR